MAFCSYLQLLAKHALAGIKAPEWQMLQNFQKNNLNNME